jgi:hypothetical protein
LHPQIAILLISSLLKRFELALEPCKFSCRGAIALDEERGGPKQNNGGARYPGVARFVAVLNTGDFRGTSRDLFHLGADLLARKALVLERRHISGSDRIG